MTGWPRCGLDSCAGTTWGAICSIRAMRDRPGIQCSSWLREPDKQALLAAKWRPQFPENRAGSTGRCNTISKFTCRSLKAQSLSRALIEAQSYLVEIALRVTGQVSFLGKVLSQ
jgi:hypothetical protein